MKTNIAQLLGIVLLFFANRADTVDFNIGVSILPTSSPTVRSMSNKERNRLKALVAKRYDLPEKWLNLMNQRQLYALELEEKYKN
mgnify:CR=1 FL=1